MGMSEEPIFSYSFLECLGPYWRRKEISNRIEMIEREQALGLSICSPLACRMEPMMWLT
jgi:hypothetical protein